MDPNEHLAAFVETFVLPAKKERWRWLISPECRERSRRGADLFSDLDPRFYTQLDGSPSLDPSRIGVLFRLWDQPEVVTAGEAVSRDHYRDALFSLVPGRLAVVFWHHGGCRVCER